MYNSRSHPLLAQIPLTVSPFISLPTATTLPYTYKPIPSTLPPSSTADSSGIERAKYVIAPSGHAAHPDEIIASCQALQAHLKKMQQDAEQTIKDWENDLREQELAEKRRVAPGWLDREEKILEPKRNNVASPAPGNGHVQSANIMDQYDEENNKPASNPAGEELDRAFGGMDLRKG